MGVHIRKQIRDAVVARLVAEVPSVQGRVFNARPFPPAPHESPCLQVYTPADNARQQEKGRVVRPQEREVTVLVIAYAREKSDAPDDELDTIAVEVERALADAKAVAPMLTDIEFAGTQVAQDAESVIHGVTQSTFVATTFVPRGQPDNPLVS